MAGGGVMKIVNQTVPLALENLGYREEEIAGIVDYVNENDTIEGAADLKPEHLAVFDCAFQPPNGTRFIPWRAHVLMMAAACAAAVASMQPQGRAPRVLLTSFPQEPHSLGLLMVEALLAVEGASCVPMGTEACGRDHCRGREECGHRCRR